MHSGHDWITTKESLTCKFTHTNHETHHLWSPLSWWNTNTTRRQLCLVRSRTPIIGQLTTEKAVSRKWYIHRHSDHQHAVDSIVTMAGDEPMIDTKSDGQKETQKSKNAVNGVNKFWSPPAGWPCRWPTQTGRVQWVNVHGQHICAHRIAHNPHNTDTYK